MYVPFGPFFVCLYPCVCTKMHSGCLFLLHIHSTRVDMFGLLITSFFETFCIVSYINFHSIIVISNGTKNLKFSSSSFYAIASHLSNIPDGSALLTADWLALYIDFPLNWGWYFLIYRKVLLLLGAFVVFQIKPMKEKCLLFTIF